MATPVAIPAAPEPSALHPLPAVVEPRLPELSGLAVSRRAANRWWALNDSGNGPELLALDDRGHLQGVVRIAGEINHDWEDLASFEDDDGCWLLIGDIGDNFALRGEVRLILLREPDPADAGVAPTRVLRRTWAGGARDSEALAVDVAARRVLLADKGRHPAGLYATPLEDDGTPVAIERIADFPPLLPGAPPLAQSVASRRWRATPTAMDLSPDGRRLLVLTYEGLSRFERDTGQTWAEALRRPAAQFERLPLPRAGGYEAAALDQTAAGALAGNEGRRIVLYRWRFFD